MSYYHEIALLKSHIDAYVARNSMLQSRLLSTLDTLDVLRRTHQEELLSVTTERDQLKVMLQRYVDFVKSVQLSHDDMRDAVMKLVEKVEVTNDYSQWPHSQIYLSSPADPFRPMQISDESQNEEHLSLYAASLIEVLRKQLNSERLAHTRTRDLANAQLLELNAKLSRRDAELESCIASAEHFRSPREGHDFGTGDARREMARITDGCDLMSPDEMNSLSDLTAVRNKILETEVKMARRLEEARSARRRTPGPSSNSMTQPLNPRRLSKDRTSNRVLDSDQLIGLESQINKLGLNIDAFAAERKAIAESEGLAPLRVQPELEPSAEKNPECSSDELHLRLQHLELECDRLTRRETELCEQRTDAQERENVLLAEIDALRQKSSNYADVAVGTEPVASSPLPPTEPEDLLDPNEGEQSMELATPLMPTSILTAHLTVLTHDVQQPRNDNSSGNSEPVQQTPLNEYIYAPTISLPHSPELEGLSAWEENSPSGLTISASDFPLPPGFPSTIPHRSNAADT